MDAKNLFETLLLRAIVRDIADDKRYGCYCGTGPYVDGEPCPKCAAIQWVENSGESHQVRNLQTEGNKSC